MIKRLILYICVFLVVTQPYVKISSVTFSFVYLFLLSPILAYMLGFKIQRYIINYLIISTLSCAFVFIVGLKSGDVNTRPLWLFFFYFFILNTAYLFKCLVDRYFELDIDSILKIVVNVITINAAFIIALNIGLIDNRVFYSFIYVDPKVFSYPITRYPGFVYDSFSYASLFCSYGIIISCYLYYIRKGISHFGYYSSIIICLVAAFFSGRTGLLVSCIVLFLFNFKLNLRSLCFLIFFVISIMIFISVDLGSYEWMKEWALGYIIEIANGHNVTHADSSINGVASMILIPDNLIFGDSVTFTAVPSDLGIIRFFNSMGLVGLLCFAMFYIYHLFYFFKFRDGFGVSVVLLLMILNFKDIYFVSPYSHFVLIAIMLVYSKSKRVCFEK